jgi:hypothetical protein
MLQSVFSCSEASCHRRCIGSRACVLIIGIYHHDAWRLRAGAAGPVSLAPGQA